MSNILGSVAIMQAYANRRIRIDPWALENVGPASLDLRLGRTVKAFADSSQLHNLADGINPRYIQEYSTNGYILEPQEFILAHTMETIELVECPNPLVAWVEGRSSVGRNGVGIHITAGFIDPGFRGQITLEVYNFSPYRFVLHEGLAVCQLVFAETTGVGTFYGKRPGSKYQGQMGAQHSLIKNDGFLPLPIEEEE
jgi:dCTP deaminase